ncbi:hypothetical protein FB008_11261 [Sinorhizobium medicae]|nr:hypothetical protein FB008_11261 [Sinorhizobium medicae]
MTRLLETPLRNSFQTPGREASTNAYGTIEFTIQSWPDSGLIPA